jgi:cytochrome P450
VVAELDEVLVGRRVTQADVASLPLLGAVLKESLRLFPPAWTIERRAEQSDEIDGHVLPAGSTVLLSPYLTHRHPEFWDNPEGFDPDRWLDGGPVLPRGLPAVRRRRPAVHRWRLRHPRGDPDAGHLLPLVEVDLAPGPPLRPFPGSP